MIVCSTAMELTLLACNEDLLGINDLTHAVRETMKTRNRQYSC